MVARRIAMLALTTMLLYATPAGACPFCDGGPDGVGVNEVREALLGDDFWFHLGAVASPLALLLGVVAAIHFEFPTLRRGSSE